MTLKGTVLVIHMPKRWTGPPVHQSFYSLDYFPAELWTQMSSLWKSIVVKLFKEDLVLRPLKADSSWKMWNISRQVKSLQKSGPTVIISAAPPLKKAFLLRDELSVNLGGSAVYPPLQLGITNIANNGQAQLAVVIDGDDDKGNGGENQINSFRFQDDPWVDTAGDQRSRNKKMLNWSS